VRSLFLIGFPTILISLAIPLILGRVPPNGYYGFRTSKTLSSPAIWYPANRASGWYLLCAGILCLAANLAIAAFRPDWFAGQNISRVAFLFLFAVLCSLAASFLYLRRL
jgi:uncharacterized membrane protein